MNEVFQPWRTFKPDEDNKPYGWIQWKGTNVCMDVYCKCGEHLHVDADFCYAVKCVKCKQIYELSCYIEMNPVDSVDHECVRLATDSDGDK